MFLAFDSQIVLYGTKITNHTCKSKIQGCVIFAQSKSLINGINVIISNIQSLTDDNILISASFAVFNNLFMLNVQVNKGKGSCLGAIESHIELNFVRFEKYLANCLNIEKSYISTSNTIFEDNLNDGNIRSFGAFYCLNCLLNIIMNSKFQQNKNVQNGAAVFLINDFKNKSLGTEISLGTIDNCTFFQNIAVENGGAIYLENQLISIKNSFFFQNQAKKGGALYNYIAG